MEKRENKESIGLGKGRANKHMVSSPEENFPTDNWTGRLEADTRHMMMHCSDVYPFFFPLDPSILFSDSLLFENSPAIHQRERWHCADCRLALGLDADEREVARFEFRRHA